MKVAVPLIEDAGSESRISPHFGRARYFGIAEVEDGKVISWNVHEIPFEEHKPGQLPALVKKLGADFLLVYGIGINAQEVFTGMGIEVITGALGENFREVVEGFASGRLTRDVNWKEKEEFGGPR